MNAVCIRPQCSHHLPPPSLPDERGEVEEAHGDETMVEGMDLDEAEAFTQMVKTRSQQGTPRTPSKIQLLLEMVDIQRTSIATMHEVVECKDKCYQLERRVRKTELQKKKLRDRAHDVMETHSAAGSQAEEGSDDAEHSAQ